MNDLRDRIILALDGWHRLYFVDEEDALSGYESMADALAPLIREALAGAWDEGYGPDVDCGLPRANPYRGQRAILAEMANDAQQDGTYGGME